LVFPNIFGRKYISHELHATLSKLRLLSSSQVLMFSSAPCSSHNVSKGVSYLYKTTRKIIPPYTRNFLV
jgi:hypothetical protein